MYLYSPRGNNYYYYYRFTLTPGSQPREVVVVGRSVYKEK
jgi:hypothetical protein